MTTYKKELTSNGPKGFFKALLQIEKLTQVQSYRITTTGDISSLGNIDESTIKSFIPKLILDIQKKLDNLSMVKYSIDDFTFLHYIGFNSEQ